MTDGLNRAFAANPLQFLQQHPLEIDNHCDLYGEQGAPHHGTRVGVPQGLHKFDLSNRSLGLVNLRSYSDRGWWSRVRGNSLKGYWLPWRSEPPVVSMTLGNGADYFFTSPPVGCRIEVAGTANPLVLHISGQESVADRARLAAEHMGAQAGNARSFRPDDTRTGYGETGVGFLVGVRSGGTWRFFGQVIAPAVGPGAHSQVVRVQRV